MLYSKPELIAVEGDISSSVMTGTMACPDAGDSGSSETPAFPGGASSDCFVADRSLDLEAMLGALHESGIYAGVQTCKAGILIWIGDSAYRVRKDHLIERGKDESWPEKRAAAWWLHIMALRLFADSPYALRHGRGGR